MANTWRRRMKRVVSDTLQWRLIAVTADFIVLGVITGEPLLAGTAAFVLFMIKTVLFAFWRTWREAQLAD